MPHNFTDKKKIRTIIFKALKTIDPDITDFGHRKLYRCTSCHNLQAHLPTCQGYDCHRDGTLVDAYSIDPVLVDIAEVPTDLEGGIPSA